jgi:beta-lactamase regulating signal transducer with metallopeptidase domain/ankyrin repeat protein
MSASTLSSLVFAVGASTLATLVVKATLTLAFALLLIRLARGASASLRHAVAAAGFAILLLLPLAALFAPARVIRVDAPAVTAARRPAPAEVPLPTALVARPRETGATAPRAIDPLRAAAGVYLVGAVLVSASLFTGISRIRRIRRRAEVSVAGTLLANGMARAEAGRTGIEVAFSPELPVPITLGWPHPVILLPAEAAAWDEAALKRAVRHELEHIVRADWATQVVSRLALAVYWPHPLAWMLWSRLRLEAERACDDAVIRSRGEAVPYAEQLVTLARRVGDAQPIPALSMATRSNLGLRVEAILDGRRRRGARSRLSALTVGGLALALAWAIAPVQVMARAVEPPPRATEPPDHDDAADPDDDDDKKDSRDVALLEAAEKGAIAKMRRLLDQGARADAVIQGDGSPLIAAARAGRLDAMKLLIGAGANVNRGVSGDGSPLIMAANEGYVEAVRLLLDQGADIDLGVPGDGNALIMAAGAGEVEVMRLLLDRGASIEMIVPGDENPLIKASESGEAGAVRLLLERGANVNARAWAETNTGRGEWRTPLKMARRKGHQDVVRILVEAGARE